MAGYSNTSANSNVFIGNEAGYSNTTGWANVAIGFESGQANTTGQFNTYLGLNSGRLNNGNSNVMIGFSAGDEFTAGHSNVILGNNAGGTNQTGSFNVMLGTMAGLNNTGERNVFLGYGAGYDETGSDKLYIDNSTTTDPLIWGDFENDVLGFNARVGVGTKSPSSTAQMQIIGSGRTYALYTINTDGVGTNYGALITAGSTGTNGAQATRSLVYRNGTGTYYSGYFYDTGTGGAYNGLYADLRSGDAIDIAEYIYDTFGDTGPADVVVADPNNKESVLKCSRPFETSVIGVISTKPHLIMGMELVMDEETGEIYEDVNAAQLALAGRVPVKVTDENGPIQIGDYITTSSTPGYAMKWTLLDVNEASDFDELKSMLSENEKRRSAIIGKALEVHESGTGQIVVLIGSL